MKYIKNFEQLLKENIEIISQREIDIKKFDNEISLRE